MDVVSPRLTGMGDEEGLSLFLAPCVGDCRVLVIQFLTRSEGRLCGPRLFCFPRVSAISPAKRQEECKCLWKSV